MLRLLNFYAIISFGTLFERMPKKSSARKRMNNLQLRRLKIILFFLQVGPLRAILIGTF
jgi:hypothetical protein